MRPVAAGHCVGVCWGVRDLDVVTGGGVGVCWGV